MVPGQCLKGELSNDVYKIVPIVPYKIIWRKGVLENDTFWETFLATGTVQHKLAMILQFAVYTLPI